MRRLISLLSASALVASMAVASLPAAALAATPSGSVIFDNHPATLPSNLPSFGPEAYYFNEWGSGVTFDGTARKLNTATVTMSSWACETGSWDVPYGTTGACVTTPGSTYPASITFNVYGVEAGNAVGSLIATTTQTFQIPFRASSIAGGDGETWNGSSHGLATNITFNTFAGETLPDNAIFGIAYNTDTNGYTPLAGSGSPLDSLNIAVYPAAGTAAPSVGSWLSTQTYAATNLPSVVAFSGPRTGTFADGYQPAVQITALPACTATNFWRDGINLTAAQIGGTVSGNLDASGCNIGAYFDASHPGSVTGANIHGANYYGVVVNAAAVDVTNATIYDIGENPLNGSQHGVGVLYTTVLQSGASTGTSATGTLSGTTITKYQKNGVVISGSGAGVTVHDNVVIGENHVNYIAQNGIQISFGASARLYGNNVSLNYYDPAKITACGLLIYKAGGVTGQFKSGISYIKADNNFHDNETNICNFGKGGGFSPAP